MCVDVPNPSFPRAIPHGMLIIDYLHRGVLFGSLRVLPRGWVQSPSGDGSEECLRALFRVLKREVNR